MLACQIVKVRKAWQELKQCAFWFFIFFYIFFYNLGYSLLLFYTVINICFNIEIEHTAYEYIGGLH